MSNEKIIEKIQKLLNLSGDKANEHEAQSALLMAQKLMLKYKIEEHMLEGNTSKVVIDKVRCDVEVNTPWSRAIAGLFAKNFGVIMYYDKCGRSRNPVYFGEVDKALIAKTVLEYALPWLHKQSNNYATMMRNTKGITKGVKQDYIIGFINGLTEQYKKQTDTESYALVTTVSTEVKSAYNVMFESGNFKQVKLSNNIASHGSMDARKAGFDAGISYGKGIEG